MTPPTNAMLIIDTDPGVDDAMAILAAFNSPQLQIIGLTTLFGNVPTALATSNALRLVDLAAASGKITKSRAPVIQGASHSLGANGESMDRIADFVHGADGFGGVTVDAPAPSGTAMDGVTAAEFIVEKCNDHPGQVTILALGALTNIAHALQLDPQLGSKWANLYVMGGAFWVPGNVNPVAEANIFGCPQSADIVFGSSERIRVIGLDVTMKCHLTGSDLSALEHQGRYGSFISRISQFYRSFHRETYGLDAVFLHDPTALVAVLRPDLFTWQRGVVRVAVEEGLARGKTFIDTHDKPWVGDSLWPAGRPRVEVAMGVDSPAVVALLKELLAA